MGTLESVLRRYYGGNVRAAREIVEARHFERNCDADKRDHDFRKANYRRNKWNYAYEDKLNGRTEK